MQYLDKLMKEHLSAGAAILELGCGAGVPCTKILSESERGFVVTGNDISSAQVALAKIHVPKATFIQGDMMKLDFKPESFDAVLAFYSIFHLPKDEQGNMIERIRIWLKPGGWLLCNFGTNEGDVVREGWFDPSVTMFSSGLGVEGNRNIFQKDVQGLKVIEDEVAVEKVGSTEEKFHWIMAKKDEV